MYEWGCFEMECDWADKWARKNGYRDYEEYEQEKRDREYEEDEEEEEEE